MSFPGVLFFTLSFSLLVCSLAITQKAAARGNLDFYNPIRFCDFRFFKTSDTFISFHKMS